MPLLGRPGTGILPALGAAFAKAVLALLVILALGRLAFRPALRLVAPDGTPELFTGIVLLVVLGVGWVTEQAGLSMALGAFLAGLLLAETEYRPQVEGDIQPFRGILLTLFFMTVGMGLDLDLLRDKFPLLLGLLLVLLLVKSSLLAALSRALGLPMAVGAAVGIMLAQGGEFGFVLFSLARQADVISSDTAQVAMLVVGLSMAITPGLLASRGSRMEAAERSTTPRSPAVRREVVRQRAQGDPQAGVRSLGRTRTRSVSKELSDPWVSRRSLARYSAHGLPASSSAPRAVTPKPTHASSARACRRNTASAAWRVAPSAVSSALRPSARTAMASAPRSSAHASATRAAAAAPRRRGTRATRRPRG